MPIKKQLGVTSYLNYGGGRGLYQGEAKQPGAFEPRIFGIKVHRHFQTFARHHYGGGEVYMWQPYADNRLMVQRTPQNMRSDEYLELLKANGIDAIWGIQGQAAFQDTIGQFDKVQPINEADDPEDPSSWYALAEHAYQLALRYAHDTTDAATVPSVYTDPTDYRSNEPKKGLGLLRAIEILNEVNINGDWIGATRTLGPEAGAAAFYAAYTEVRSISKITLYTPSFVGINMEILMAFSDRLRALMNGAPLENVVLNFHWYPRKNNQEQGQEGTDTGASPEEAGFHDFGLQMDGLCETYGYTAWGCTETGTSAADPVDTSKNACPIQEGMTQLESQGPILLRMFLAWASCKHFDAVTFWHCRDGYDQGAYLNGGMCLDDRDWTPKPVLGYLEAFIGKFGDYEKVHDYQNTGGVYTASISGPLGTSVLYWTGGNNNGEFTPDPMQTIVTSPTYPPIDPPIPTLPDMIKLGESAEGTFYFKKK